ncbi:UNVERIFIED_CONTAM: hypothetical protein Sradi_7178200 [Sesamum radiatum]|uniref:Uncharacterized protein n=1 Tax=Sesamum radiatum TaxID=300843 RepID=A0AAW2ITZ2_SESRA
MGDPLGSPRVAPLFANCSSRLSSIWLFYSFSTPSPNLLSLSLTPPLTNHECGQHRRGQREWAPLIATNDRKCAGIHSKRQNFAAKVCHNGASPVVHVAELGESYACICSSGRSSTRAQSYASRKIRRTSRRSPLAHKRLKRA